MPLDSQCRSLLELIKQLGNPDLSTMEVADARALRDRQKLPPGPAAEVRDHRIDGPGGALPIRDYRAPGASGTLPALVYFHGGGFVLGSIESHDAVCRQLAVDSGCAVLSVEYRLAPEQKFPGAVDDALCDTRSARSPTRSRRSPLPGSYATSSQVPSRVSAIPPGGMTAPRKSPSPRVRRNMEAPPAYVGVSRKARCRAVWYTQVVPAGSGYGLSSWVR